MSAIIDFLLNQQLLKQQQAQNQGAIQSMFGGAPPSSINVTPQMQMPMQMQQSQSPLLIPPQGGQPPMSSPNLAAAQQADPGVAAALQNQLQTNQQSGAYDVNQQPGAVAPAYSGPNATGMQDFFSKLPAQTASLLLDTMGKQQIGQNDPEYQARLKTLQNANDLQDQQTKFFKNALTPQPGAQAPTTPNGQIGGVPLEDLTTAFQSGGSPAAQKLIADAATKKIDALAKKNSNPLVTGDAATALGLDPKYNWQQGVDGVYKAVEPPRADTEGLSPIAKLVADHKAGRIDDETFRAAMAKETHVSEPSDNAGWQVANDPTTNTPFRINVRTGETKDLKGNAYTPGGFQKPASGQARSALAMGVQKFMQEHPDATSQDIAGYAGNYQKTVSQIGGETKADVSSLTDIQKRGTQASAQEQAMSGAISQITGLMNKGAGTSLGPVINRWYQAGRKATGDPDVAAFNTAVDTAAQEYAKIITGSSGSTDASRAEASSMMDKFQNPAALQAQIAVIQKDAHFKIQSYNDHADFIRNKLQPGDAGETKTINGVTYHKVNGQWMQ